MENKTLFSTREIARFLNINEKMVYTLIAEKRLPTTKATLRRFGESRTLGGHA